MKMRNLNDLINSGAGMLSAPTRMLVWRDVLRLAAFFRTPKWYRKDYIIPTTREALFRAHTIVLKRYEDFAEILREEMLKIGLELGEYPPQSFIFNVIGDLERWGWKTPVLPKLWEDKNHEYDPFELKRIADSLEPERPDYRLTGVV
jgi:hypothetical protein